MTVLTEHPRTHFTLPDGGFAPAPAERRGVDRDAVRLLVAREGGVEHRLFRDLPGLLAPGDVLVVNDSATVAGQLDGLLGGHPVVVHLATPLDDGDWVVELRTAPDAARAVLDVREGAIVSTGAATLRLVEPYPYRSSPTGAGNRLWRARVRGDVQREVERHGRPIAYGYLDRRYPLEDYQTVFATHPGSAEMPSAARPFTDRVVTRLVSHGVVVAPITLHTGVSSQEAGEGPQPERFAVSEATARTVNAARWGGSRVVAVGTTATRAIESAVDADGCVRAAAGWTDRIVTPLDPPRVVDGLITGWHDPQASHLLLVEAVAGPDLTQAAYEAATASGYLWHEFGDSTLLLPARPAGR